jgi:hypothetical protein
MPPDGERAPETQATGLIGEDVDDVGAPVDA